MTWKSGLDFRVDLEPDHPFKNCDQGSRISVHSHQVFVNLWFSWGRIPTNSDFLSLWTPELQSFHVRNFDVSMIFNVNLKVECTFLWTFLCYYLKPNIVLLKVVQSIWPYFFLKRLLALNFSKKSLKYCFTFFYYGNRYSKKLAWRTFMIW